MGQSIILEKVDFMNIVITNGMYYIAKSESGGIIKTPVLEDAQRFNSVNKAMKKIHKAPGKCKGYYPYDTEDSSCECGNKKKRKIYSADERKMIYDKSNGRCELCGHSLVFKEMTLDHVIPISMGGEDGMENLQAACLACNQFKKNILPDEFMERITDIFLYQMEKRHGNGLKWKMVHKMMDNML